MSLSPPPQTSFSHWSWRKWFNLFWIWAGGVEGTFTAGITATTGTITIATTANKLAYRKTGRQVTVLGWISVTSVSAPSGVLKITGLPFKGGNRSAGFVDVAAGICQGDQWGIAPVGGTFCEIIKDVDYLAVYERGTTAIGVSIAANVAAGTDFYINITYMTDDR